MGSSRRALNRSTTQKKQTLSNPNFAKRPKPAKFNNEKKEEVREVKLPDLNLVEIPEDLNDDAVVPYLIKDLP